MRIIIIVRVLGWDYILKLSKYYLWKILLSLRCTHYFADIHHFTNRMMLLSPDKSATLFRSANTCHQVSFSKTFHVGNLELYILTYQIIIYMHTHTHSLSLFYHSIYNGKNFFFCHEIRYSIPH